MSHPLTGIRILAITQYGAGPFAMQQLADLGAEIVKVENPLTEGDVARRVPPYLQEGLNDSVYFQSFNRGTLGMTLNLRNPQGQEVLVRLVKNVHAVFSNLRGDLPQKLGLRYPQLKAHNPRIVTCHLTGYGMDNSRSTRPAYDHLIQGEAGYMAMTGELDGRPQRCGVSVVDFAGGYNAAFAMTTGLLKAQMTGEGCDLDVSLYDTAVSMLTYQATWHLTKGYEISRQPDSSHPAQVPIGLFETSDGYLMIMCAKEEFYQALCDKLGRAEWKEDARFRRFADRLKNRTTLIPMLKVEFRKRSTAEWLALFGDDVPCAPVQSPGETLGDPFLVERGMIGDYEHPQLGRIRTLRSAIKVEGPPVKLKPAAELGEHTAAVLTSLCGYTLPEIAALRRAGAI